jgi:lactoylglutathione lyase
MEYLWTTLTISNMEKSLSFYMGNLSLAIRSRFRTGDGTEIVFLGGASGTAVELIERGPLPVSTAVRGAGISLGFKTESLEQSMRALADAGIPVERGPIQAGGGTRFFFVRDPDGYEIQIVEQAGR